METLVQLSQQYKSEFEDKYEGIRKRGLEQLQEAQDKIQQIQPELQSKQEEIVTLLRDTVSLHSPTNDPSLELCPRRIHVEHFRNVRLDCHSIVRLLLHVVDQRHDLSASSWPLRRRCDCLPNRVHRLASFARLLLEPQQQ